jgi:hypothetical protein
MEIQKIRAIDHVHPPRDGWKSPGRDALPVDNRAGFRRAFRPGNPTAALYQQPNQAAGDGIEGHHIREVPEVGTEIMFANRVEMGPA